MTAVSSDNIVRCCLSWNKVGILERLHTKRYKEILTLVKSKRVVCRLKSGMLIRIRIYAS